MLVATDRRGLSIRRGTERSITMQLLLIFKPSKKTSMMSSGYPLNIPARCWRLLSGVEW
jgi:hypothetical protein